MNVLITGGAGFIGSHLADQLLARGDKVLVLDNYATGRRDNLTPHPQLTVVEGTIADRDLVNRTFESFRPEVVVHAAAAYKDPNNWIEDTLTNVLGAVHVAQAAKAQGARRLIYFQTSLCYGLKPLEQPITLKHPLFSGDYPGGSSYAISKTGGEQYLELSGLDFLSFRLANAYGPRNLSGPPPTFYQRLTQGKPCFVMDTRRDFIYVADLIEVVVKAIDGMGTRGYYHISTGRDYAIKELFEAVVEALGIKLDKPVEVRPRGADDVPTILIDPSKTEQDFQWKAHTPLKEGIARAVEYYRKFGVAETFTHLRLETPKS
ncbi:MAG: NAD-dependent epimerase/dehydratase family protein [Verrucomicrobia bacterium]|nr:NAD-dependent epimerase/dehydratase family protein [Verrucomicrobiota bacterium]